MLPSLDARLAVAADAVLRERGVDVRLGTSVREATADGVRPDPLVQSLGLARRRAGWWSTSS